MVIRQVNNVPTDTLKNPFGNGTPYDSRFGFWGYVEDVNSEMNCCTVKANSGFTYKNIPVASKEWTNSNGSGERDLPQKGSRVFVLMPTGTISGAFILCSGYALGESDSHNLYCKNSTEKDYFNASKEKITQSGWNIKESFENGNISFTSKDEKVKLEINLSDDSKHSQTKQIKITAWENEIVITEKGMTITPKKKVTLDAKDGIEINGNNKVVEIKNANTFKVNGNLEVSV